jgi:hypothetical protein
MIDWEDRAKTAEAALAAAEKERDDYRFWNERVRVCEAHTDEIAAPEGDCLVCALAAALERERELEREAGINATAAVAAGAEVGLLRERVRVYLRELDECGEGEYPQSALLDLIATLAEDET